MSRISDLLSEDPLLRFQRELVSAEVLTLFEPYLPPSPSSRVIGALYTFVSQAPFRYWDSGLVELALNLLERDINRSIAAVQERSPAIDRGMQELFRPSPVALVETRLDLNRPKDLVQLTAEFIPDYLRLAEHVYGNLLEFYWSVAKRGGVDGKFSMRGAAALLKAKQLDNMLEGYSERVRNGIAHGEVAVTGFGIEFGAQHGQPVSVSEFLRAYDNLRRTCNSLVVALLLFWERVDPTDALRGSIPVTLIVRFAAGAINRKGLKILGAVESLTPLAGKQLHVAVRMSMRARTQVLGAAARLTFHMIEAGADEYDRFLIQVDHNLGVSSLVRVNPAVFQELLRENADDERLPEAFEDMQLLWFDESAWKTRFRAWQTILETGFRWMRQDVLRRWHEQGIWIGKGRYHVRQIENLGSQGISRVRVRAVLKDPSDADDRDIIRAILADIVKKYSRRLMRSRSRFLDSGIPWPKWPRYVWVILYRVDGTLRWLRGGGWRGGNIVAVAELTRGNADPVLVETAEEVFKGIRLRYSIDTEKAREALHELSALVSEIRQSRLN